jgi:hypothetical protein
MPEPFVVEATLRLDVPGLDAERHLVVIKRVRSEAPDRQGPAERT